MNKLDQLVSEADVLETVNQPIAPVAPDQRVSSTRRSLTMAVALLLSACGSKADKYEGADGVPAVQAVTAVPAVPAIEGRFDKDGNPVVVSATVEDEK